MNGDPLTNDWLKKQANPQWEFSGNGTAFIPLPKCHGMIGAWMVVIAPQSEMHSQGVRGARLVARNGGREPCELNVGLLAGTGDFLKLYRLLTNLEV